MKNYPLLNQAPCHKDVRGSGCIAPRTFLSLTVNGGERSVSRSGRFTLGESAPVPIG